MDECDRRPVACGTYRAFKPVSLSTAYILHEGAPWSLIGLRMMNPLSHFVRQGLFRIAVLVLSICTSVRSTSATIAEEGHEIWALRGCPRNDDSRCRMTIHKEHRDFKQAELAEPR